ncbi:cyclase family protein [Rhodococcus opacus]|uniref:cyclase family protein n=1 Tax=Rhodococcus opacus TaxID=37919 RepID=UPI0013001B34|nr:cyclase family protein [Rhodococcus opacus]
MSHSTLSSTATIEGYFSSLSNWGRWGDDDRRGTLNLITPEVRRAAAATVRSGRAISLARDLDPADPDPLHSGFATVHRKTDVREAEKAIGRRLRWDGFGDHIAIAPHGGNAHLDGLAHYSWDDKYYNDFPASATTEDGGAVDLSMRDAEDGIVTRGVLLDVAAALGVDRIERGYAISVEDLEAAEKRQGVCVRAGDALLVHSGGAAEILEHGPKYLKADPGIIDQVQTGLDSSVLPWLRERDISVMGADGTHDVQPPQFEDLNFARPIHSVCLVAIGLWLMDNLNLTELSRACEEAQQWEFLLTANPWRFVGSTSSPLNPVAVL